MQNKSIHDLKVGDVTKHGKLLDIIEEEGVYSIVEKLKSNPLLDWNGKFYWK